MPIAGVIGDYGAIAVAKDSPFKNFKEVVDAYTMLTQVQLKWLVVLLEEVWTI